MPLQRSPRGAWKRLAIMENCAPNKCWPSITGGGIVLSLCGISQLAILRDMA